MKASCFFFLLCFLSVPVSARTLAPPLVEVTFETKPEVFEHASATRPLVIHSAEQAEKRFTEKGLAELKKTIDFDQQTLLVFAWKGSGRDQLETQIAESFPEQVTFQYRRGMTKDLRSHVKVYALRKNVTWTAE